MLYLAYLHYEPWSLLMVDGSQISVLAHIELFEEIPVNFSVGIEMVRLADGVNISIPCSDTSFGKIGSCDYDGNTFLNNSLFPVLPEFFCGRNDTRKQ